MDSTGAHAGQVIQHTNTGTSPDNEAVQHPAGHTEETTTSGNASTHQMPRSVALLWSSGELRPNHPAQPHTAFPIQLPSRSEHANALKSLVVAEEPQDAEKSISQATHTNKLVGVMWRVLHGPKAVQQSISFTERAAAKQHTCCKQDQHLTGHHGRNHRNSKTAQPLHSLRPCRGGRSGQCLQ